MSTLLEAEILEQPAALARQLAAGRAEVVEVAAEIRRRAPRWVVMAARGTSDNAARYAQYLLGAHNRMSVGLATPSLFTLYGAPPRVDGSLVVGISQSGQSPDIVAVVEESRRQGALTLAITNDGASPLARAAELRLPLHAGEERAVAATKTYTTELMALAMLSAALEGDAARWDDLAAVPAHVETALGLREAAFAGATATRSAERFVVLGRGFNYATAFEIALKIAETSYVVAAPYSSADFLHGPAAMLEVGFPVVVVAPRGKLDDAGALLTLLEERQVEVIAISNDPAVLGRARTAMAIPEVPEWVSPIVAVVAGQWLALAIAIARGRDPDRPRGLSKVTQTR